MSPHKPVYFTLIVLCLNVLAVAQTGPGVALYPTGTETGIGFRSSKEQRLIADIRIAKAAFFSDHTKNSSFGTEASAVCRIIKYEKVRFHIGLGYKADWNFPQDHKHGAVVPVGVEAFPFPFQNAGLFFESAPYILADHNGNYTSGIRTAAGFIFYFVKKQKQVV